MKRSKQEILEMVKNLPEPAMIAHEESNWDLLVLTERSISQADEKFGEAFSTIIFNKEVWNSKMNITPFYENVMNEGLVL